MTFASLPLALLSHVDAASTLAASRPIPTATTTHAATAPDLDQMIRTAKEHMAEKDAMIQQLNAALDSTRLRHAEAIAAIRRQHERNLTAVHRVNARLSGAAEDIRSRERGHVSLRGLSNAGLPRALGLPPAK